MAISMRTSAVDAGSCVRPRQSAVPGFARVLVASLGVYAAALTVLLWLQGANLPFNEMRGAPTLAIFHGIRIYQVGLKDVSFAVLYAPLSYLLHLPAAFFPGPRSFFLSGCLISFAAYSIPLAFFLPRLERAWWVRVLVGSVFLLFTVYSTALKFSAMSISPDGAALGFSGAACAVLFFSSRRRPWRDAALAAGFACLSVFSKQNMAAVPAVLVVFAWLLGGRQFAFRLLVCLSLGTILSVVVVAAVYRDLAAVYSNNVVVPRNFPLVWKRGIWAIRFLYQQSAPILVAMAALILVSFSDARLALRGMDRAELIRQLLFPVAALALVPASIFGMVFWGGADNGISPALYFLLLSLVALAYSLLAGGASLNAGPAKAFWTLLVLTAISSPLLSEELTPSAFREAARNTDAVYQYDLRHPGDVYFPFHQVSVFYAERTFYHGDWAISHFVQGKIPFSKDQLWAHVPPNAKYLAYPPVDAPLWLQPYLAPSAKRVEIPELAGFTVFEIER